MKHRPILLPLFGGESIANAIHEAFDYSLGDITLHQFPDGETMVRIHSCVQDQDVIVIANLDHPNNKLLPLLFTAETARDLGAKKIGLVAPYLPYMRQDKQFHGGEGISSVYFARLVSTYFDGLVTIDPHLHRWHDLNDIYTIPAKALHATDTIAAWIKTHVPDAILMGPDAESSQWVSEIAHKIDAPFLILDKERQGDHSVKVSTPNIALYQNHSPVLVDDIISTGVTMMETVSHLKALEMKPPVCIGIHALFSDDAYENLQKTGAKIITCNTILHASNGIDLKGNLVHAVGAIFEA